MNLNELKNLGPKRLEALKRLNINNINDLVFFSPNYFEDRQTEYTVDRLEDGQDALVRVKILSKGFVKKLQNKLTMTVFEAGDEGSEIELIFFNQPWARNNFKIGEWYFVFGKVNVFRGKRSISNPIYSKEKNGEIGSVVPIYPLTRDITQKLIHGFITEALKSWEGVDILPKSIADKYGMEGLKDLLFKIHHPKSINEAKIALKSMAYIESFALQITRSDGQTVSKERKGYAISDTEIERVFLRELPFKLTEGQKAAIVDIKNDLEGPNAMNRLVQGDVGSGKTVVSQYAAIKAAASGYQVAFMAPTAILAAQNYKKLNGYCVKYGYRCELLTSDTSAKERNGIIEKLSNGAIDILVGTHSLLNDEIAFNRLGLVVIDEQHRFGVKQRASLIDKDEEVNILIMSATPIPRSLALVIYDEMDISEIRTVPEGRVPIATYGLNKNQKHDIYDFVKKELNKGRQAYFVCSLIEESEVLNAVSATDLYEELGKIYSGEELALLTGITPEDEKDKIMKRFYEGEINVLVSTTVIEVGIDVPNATVMVIMNAERFGLSQLHQLRGRVGRGNHKSYCLLVNDSESEDAFKRIKILERSSDGFEIAAEDLKVRGPGEFLGLRQHGKQKYKFLDFDRDFSLMLRAKNDFKEYLANCDYDEYKKIKANVEEYWERFEIGVLN